MFICVDMVFFNLVVLGQDGGLLEAPAAPKRFRLGSVRYHYYPSSSSAQLQGAVHYHAGTN